MYVPTHFAETRNDVLHSLIHRHPLGTLIVNTAMGLEANHVPFVLDETAGPYGTLRAHVAKANPVWKNLSGTAEALVVFQGPDAYVSPSVYEAKRVDGKVVPTWNYTAVHAYGPARAKADATWLRALLDRLTDTHEAARMSPWKVSDAPSDYVDKLLQAIVGIEIPVTRLVGKWKVSQNRSAADRESVVADLEKSVMSHSEMAELVRQAGKP